MPRQSSGPLRQFFTHRATLPFAATAETGTFAEPPQRKQAFCSCRAGIEQADGEKRTTLFTEGTGAAFFIRKTPGDMCPVPPAEMTGRLTAEPCGESKANANAPALHTPRQKAALYQSGFSLRPTILRPIAHLPAPPLDVRWPSNVHPCKHGAHFPALSHKKSRPTRSGFFDVLIDLSK